MLCYMLCYVKELEKFMLNCATRSNREVAPLFEKEKK